jgi:hypothetical protein
VLPLSLEDLFNYTALILKFCTKKPIWALLLRQVFWGGGKGAFRPKNGCNVPSAGYIFSRKKIFRKLNTYCVSYCKYDLNFNKYDMYSFLGIDKKTYGEGIGITYIHT